MKPKNFPARKNGRRADKLARLLEIHEGDRTSGQEIELAALLKRVVTEQTARAIRTKKARGTK